MQPPGRVTRMPFDDPQLTPEQRRREVAGILAAGLLRYLRRVRLATPPPVEESAQNQLDVCGEKRLIGPHGSAGEGPRDSENQRSWTR